MDTTTIFTHEAPQSNSVIVTRLKAVSDLNRLKDVMHAEHIEWDTKVTNSGSRFFDPKRKLATAMSEVYKALEELASAEETPWDYDQKYRDLTKAQSALTSAKANSQLGPEDENQLAIDEGNVVFTVFAHIATRSGYLNSMVDFGPCRTKSKAYFKGFVSWLLQRKVVDLTEEEKQARSNLVFEAGVASCAHIMCINGQSSTWVLELPVRVASES